ncbi:hypothetical protein [Streptomyces sp. NBC_00847]|uniref:hypothetical protein n=1 Tax=Streptomyces sp. NBC_00847 TaxID=2975850 RepID=UPI00225E6AC2|nr:hypothetical protein [Streptomyces sp. NBC_00847]MCX4885848.1 collagen-like protein [Streptomyces sp. NBC_00847]
MTTVTGKLIGAANPQRVEMVATLVDVTGKPAVGYVSSVPGELVKPVPVVAAGDGAWTVTLTPNSLVTSQAGDTLWAIQEGRKGDGTPIVSYVAVPDSGTWWVGDILADLSSTQTGDSTVVYLAGAPGADGASAYEVAVADGFVGSEAEWLATLVGQDGDPGPAGATGATGTQGPKGDTGDTGPQPALGAAGAGPTIALKADDPTTTNARTPTAHAASHASGSSDPVTVAQSQVTGLATALSGLLPTSGGTVTGDVTLHGANLTVERNDPEGNPGAFRFRVTGSGLDLEIAGLDVFISKWANADFTGAQTNVMRWEAAGPHLIGNTQFGTGPFDSVHSIDAGTGVAALGAKNGLANTRISGRRTAAGAPTAGTWTSGDTVQDSAGAWWLCTAGGTPGTWTGGAPTSPWLFDVTASAYGAKGDAKVVADGAMASGSATLTSATAAFTAADVGKAISVKGAAATGVTTLATTITGYVSGTQVTLAASNASGGALSGAITIWGTDDTAAIQAATDAAEAYLAAGHTYAQVYFPPRPYIVAGPLSTAKSGNGQITFGVYPTTGNKKILEFRGEGDGAAVRHWEQTVPQYAGSCLISLGVYSSIPAQANDISANGNPGVISGPNEGTTNGLAYGATARFSNIIPGLKNLTILTAHSTYGLTYGAFNFYGCANARLENVGWSTAGVVPGTDYTSPAQFANGQSIGGLLPAPGNNDLVYAKNVSIGGGYTFAVFCTEHLVCDRIMVLYCWSAICPVGTYAGSVGSVHAMLIESASVEACTNEIYIVGAGSGGVGPIIDILQFSTESSTPNLAGNSQTAVNSALGRVKLTGIFSESGVSTQYPTGIEFVDGQVPRAIKRKTGAFTASVIDRTLVCDTTAGGAFTATLPAADFFPAQYTFRNIGTNALTVASAGSQSITTSAGSGTTATVAAESTLRLEAVYDGTAWIWVSV